MTKIDLKQLNDFLHVKEEELKRDPKDLTYDELLEAAYDNM